MVWDSLGSTGNKLDKASQLGTLLGELGAVPVCPVCHTLDSTGQLRAGLLMMESLEFRAYLVLLCLSGVIVH